MCVRPPEGPEITQTAFSLSIQRMSEEQVSGVSLHMRATECGANNDGRQLETETASADLVIAGGL